MTANPIYVASVLSSLRKERRNQTSRTMANPVDTFGVQSVSGATRQCWICQQNEGPYSAWTERERPFTILVEGAGNCAVNGLYRPNGFSADGGIKYLKGSRHNRFGKEHDVYILICVANDSTFRWFFSSVPVGTNPGTNEDIDYYTSPAIGRGGFDDPPTSRWVVAKEGRAPVPRLHLRYTGANDGGELRSGEEKCTLPNHRQHLLHFLSSPSEHSIDERRNVISTFFEPRIHMLASAVDRRAVREMLSVCWRWKQSVVPVFAHLDLLEHKNRIVLSMLAAWKYLAQSRADDDPVDARHVTKARTLRDMWLERRDDWKLHKKQILDAGQVHLVGKLVRPFLEVVDSCMWGDNQSCRKRRIVRKW
jgi:hypothetical protein